MCIALYSICHNTYLLATLTAQTFVFNGDKEKGDYRPSFFVAYGDPWPGTRMHFLVVPRTL